MPRMMACVTYSIQCEACGRELKSSMDKTRLYGGPLIVVPPCTECLREARSIAHEAGVDDGYKDGNEEARRKYTGS